MGKKSIETVEQRIDQGAAGQRQNVFDAANALYAQGPTAYNFDPQFLAQLQGLASSNLGLASGPLDIGQFMNPYMSEVVGAVQGDFDRMRERSLNAVGGDATAAGAFGGSRHGIAEGTALGEIAQREGQTLAGLRAGGWSEALQAAMQQKQLSGQLGLGASGMLHGMQYEDFVRMQQDPFARFQALLGSSASTPYGTTQETTSRGNLMSTLGGVASVGASMIPGGWGAAAKGLMGLFSGGKAPDVAGGIIPHMAPSPKGPGPGYFAPFDFTNIPNVGR
jgi:hypothetical protein